MRRGEALDDAFAEEVLGLQASCWDGELEVGHLILYVVRYIRPQLPPHTNKLVPHAHQVLQQLFLRVYVSSVCMSPPEYVPVYVPPYVPSGMSQMVCTYIPHRIVGGACSTTQVCGWQRTVGGVCPESTRENNSVGNEDNLVGGRF